MLQSRNKSVGATFFQIHKDGSAVEGNSYPTLAEASAALEKAGQGGEVNEVDASDRITRRYTLDECRAAARRFRHDARETPGASREQP
jgi:hypothetical protein